MRIGSGGYGTFGGAEAVHALYAPILDRIGWPVRFWMDDDERVPVSARASAFFVTEHGREHCLPDVAAAAICRVAVEDWLMEKRDAPPVRCAAGVFLVWFTRDADEQPVRFPTIHHALIAAALAVAEVKE